MTYDWTQLTEKEITNLYLYGMPTTPSDLTNEPLIRPKDAPGGGSPRYGADIVVNTFTFMTTGPGRFALGSQSAMVETFFSTFVSTQAKVPGLALTHNICWQWRLKWMMLHCKTWYRGHGPADCRAQDRTARPRKAA
jgi:hypothetical protein